MKNNKKKKKQKSIGLKKSLILLSIFDTNTRNKIFENLSLKEKQFILKSSFNSGGFDIIKSRISLNSLKIVVSELKSFIKVKNHSNFYFELFYIIFLFPLYIFFLLIRKVQIDLNLSFYFFLLPFLTFLFKQTSKFTFRGDFTNKQNFIFHTIIGIVSGFFLYIILIIINQNTFSNDIKINFINILTLAIIIPFFEELIFRYFVISLLLKSSNKIVKVIISATIFSLAHLNFENIEIIILYFFTGIILGSIYTEEKYIYPTFLSHSIANFLILFI